MGSTNNSELRKKYLKDLRDSATVATLNYEIWWGYKSADVRPKYIVTLNKYPLFFQTSIDAHFVAMNTGLYRFYETRKDTYNIPGLINLLREDVAIDASKLHSIEIKYKERAKPLWVKVSVLRNKAIGHRSIAVESDDAFKQAGISGDDYKELITLTKSILNGLSRIFDSSTHAFNLSSHDDFTNMLHDLHNAKSD